MKPFKSNFLKTSLIGNLFMIIMISYSCTTETLNTNTSNEYHVAAYIWPSCHDDPRGRELLWGEGMGEWEVIKKGNPRFDGHYQPKVPLWGYEMDDDPEVMARWIDAATDHGINVFIFDWYWYDGGPFLESSVNNGFLKAENNDKMQFYIMWANHDVRRNYWNVHRYGDDDSLLWEGAVDRENFDIVVDRVINQYFKQPNYFKIDGKPVFKVFVAHNLVKGLGGLEQTKDALDYFRDQVKKAGFPGLHLQFRADGSMEPRIMSDAYAEGMTTNELIDYFGVNSLTKYNWGHHQDYIRLGVEAMEKRNVLDAELNIPYFPNVSKGWDDTPRFPHKGKEHITYYNKSPESFAAFLQKAKEYCDARPDEPNLITLFSWNEWVEGSYLLPCMKNGFNYLEAVKKVMEGRYDPYNR